MNNGNPYQSRVGRSGKFGPTFPMTKEGDEVVVFAAPGHWDGHEKNVVNLVVNLNAITLTAIEAQQLAAALIYHANDSGLQNVKMETDK